MSCKSCSFESELSLIPERRRYLLGTETAEMHQRNAWCRRCAEFVWGEHLPPADELVRCAAEMRERVDKSRLECQKAERPMPLLQRLSRIRRGEHARRVEEASQEVLAAERKLGEAELHLRIIQARESGPRCTECGATDLIPVRPPGSSRGEESGVDQGMPCPDCGGCLMATYGAHYLLNFTALAERKVLVHDAEGRQL